MMDSAPAQPAPKRKRRWLRGVLWTFLSLVLLLVAVRLVAGWVMDARLESRIAALRAAGEPVTFADFPLPDVPDEQNAMPLYEEAFVRLDLLPPETLNPKPLVDDETGKIKPVELQSVPDEARPIVQLLREAGERPLCRPVIDLRGARPTEDVVSLPVLHFRNTRELLQLSVRENRAENRPDEALDDLVALLGSRRAVCEEPTLLAGIIRTSFVVVALKDMQQTLDTSDPSSEALRRARAAIEQCREEDLLATMLRGERCFDLMWIQATLQDPNRMAALFRLPESRWQAVRGLLFRPMLVADALRSLDYFEYWIVCSRKPWYEAGVRRESSRMDIQLDPPPWYRPFTSGGDQCYYAFAVTHHVMNARLDCANVAIALRLHRLKHGAYPESLDALVPEFVDTLPVDPFSGKPYVYHREGQGFIVYSVGVNGVDDGGVEVPGDRDQGDIVWKCSR